MDALDVAGAVLGTAIALAPLVMLAYRESDRETEQPGVLVALTDILTSTAPLLILGLLHMAFTVAAFLLVLDHWQYLHGGGVPQGWWFFVWVTLFFTLSSLIATTRTAQAGWMRPASTGAVLLLVLFCAGFIGGYLWNGQTHLLLADYSRSIIPSMAGAWVLLLAVRVFPRRGVRPAPTPAGTTNHAGNEEILHAREREARIMAMLDQREAELTRVTADHDRLNAQFRDLGEREASLLESLDRLELTLAERDVEMSRLAVEVQHAQAREEDLRAQLETLRTLHSTASNAAAAAQLRLEGELEDARRRERDLLDRMEKLSVVITFLKRRTDTKRTAKGGAPFDKLIDADSYYAGILGVRGPVSPETVKERHRELVVQNHPDRMEVLDPAIRAFAEVRMKEMNEAYQHFKKKFGM